MSEARMASDEVAERTLDEFTLFPKLPLAMQLKVWKHAVPGPRVVGLSFLNKTSKEPSLFGSIDQSQSLRTTEDIRS
jgi:hypothetical protein